MTQEQLVDILGKIGIVVLGSLCYYLGMIHERILKSKRSNVV
jgi:hypothetical protein